mmetsp:Transcript_46676/g.107877  ORF Transcript_46676/g.107877 Transcript_46676/m.107877 type:complete len:306 (-) Transcript_46676:93-1010(-)
MQMWACCQSSTWPQVSTTPGQQSEAWPWVWVAGLHRVLPHACARTHRQVCPRTRQQVCSQTALEAECSCRCCCWNALRLSRFAAGHPFVMRLPGEGMPHGVVPSTAAAVPGVRPPRAPFSRYRPCENGVPPPRAQCAHAQSSSQTPVWRPLTALGSEQQQPMQNGLCQLSLRPQPLPQLSAPAGPPSRPHAPASQQPTSRPSGPRLSCASPAACAAAPHAPEPGARAAPALRPPSSTLRPPSGVFAPRCGAAAREPPVSFSPCHGPSCESSPPPPAVAASGWPAAENPVQHVCEQRWRCRGPHCA